MKKQLTIITICYNAKDQLLQTIDSIRNQNDQLFDFVVVDGNSSDGTKAVLEKNNDFINQWTSEPDNGIYDAMQKGVGMSVTNYVLFLNAGDTFFDGVVVQKLNEILSTNQPDMLVGNAWLMQDNQVRKPDISLPRNVLSNQICHQAALYRTEYVRFDQRLGKLADYELNLRLLRDSEKAVQYVDLTICNFDQTGVSSAYGKDYLREDYLAKVYNFPLATPVFFLMYIAKHLKRITGWHGGRKS